MSKQKNNQKQRCIYLNCNEIMRNHLHIPFTPKVNTYSHPSSSSTLSYAPTFQPFLSFSTLAKFPDKQIYDLRLLIFC